MRRFDAQAPRQAPATVQRPTGRCSNPTCGCDAFIALAHCETPSGGRAVLAGGEAVNEDWTPRAGYRVLGWIERCSQCFSRERFREEVARYAEEGLRHPVNFGAHAHVRDRESFRRVMGADLQDIVQRVAA